MSTANTNSPRTNNRIDYARMTKQTQPNHGRSTNFVFIHMPTTTTTPTTAATTTTTTTITTITTITTTTKVSA